MCSSLLGCTPVETQAVTSTPAPVTNPLLALIAQSRVGASATLVDPAGGAPSVISVQSEYNSAGGQLCRAFSQTTAGRQTQLLACEGGAGWYLVPPLVTSN
jgi:hypothetical protein